VPILAALALAALGVYLYGQSLGSFASDLSVWQQWQARTWGGAALGPPLWLALTVALVIEQQERRLSRNTTRLLWVAVVALLVLGAGFGVVGTTTDLIEQWPAAQQLGAGAGQVRYVPDGPWFGVFRWYALACLLWATVNVAWLWQSADTGTPVRPRFGWLLLSSALFILGSGELAIGSSLYAVPGILGQGTLIIGMLVMGWNVARYGALMTGEVVTADFVGFAASMLLLVCLYGAIVLAFAPPEYLWLERGLPVLVAVMVTHLIMDTRGHAVDRLLYGPVVGSLRGRLKLLSDRVALQPDATAATAAVADGVDLMLQQAQEELQNQSRIDGSSPAVLQDPVQAFAVELRPLISSALKRLNNLPSLSRHRLVAVLEHIATGPTALDRAVWLRNELLQAIERLRPEHGPPPKVGSRAGPGA
jgi:hypothetical protein